MTLDADVAVIGAGPAGAWTAYLLARRGARAILLDPSHPREKPCGGGVTGRALALVAPAIDAPLPAVRVRSARFVDGGPGQGSTVRLRAEIGGNTLVVASRAAFDGLLLAAARRAGVRLAATRAVDVARDRRGFAIATADGGTVRAGFVVGADGTGSVVRRRLAGAFGRHQLSIATGYFARGATSEEIVIQFAADPPGYFWSFPRPDHLAIGVCAPADAGAGAAALRARAAAWLRSAGLAGATDLTPYAWPIPSLPARDLDRLHAGGAGWCLVGDAAGLVDPITREGIFFALQSAALAADAMSASGPDPAAQYASRVRDEIAPELARAARLKDAFFKPRFTRLLLDALERSAPIREVMADLIAGAQSYRTLKWRLARTLEIGFALKALAAVR